MGRRGAPLEDRVERNTSRTGFTLSSDRRPEEKLGLPMAGGNAPGSESQANLKVRRFAAEATTQRAQAGRCAGSIPSSGPASKAKKRVTSRMPRRLNQMPARTMSRIGT